jgi:hypothetical protein
LMLKNDKLELERGAAAKAKGDDRNNGKKNRHHARDGTVGSWKSPASLRCLWNFEQRQPSRSPVTLRTHSGRTIWPTAGRPRRPDRLRLAESLPRSVPDADRSVIYEFAMHTCREADYPMLSL